MRLPLGSWKNLRNRYLKGIGNPLDIIRSFSLDDLKNIKHNKKTAIPLLIGLLIILLPIAYFVTKNLKSVQAEWWNEDWTYRRRSIVTNNTTTETNVYISFDGTTQYIDTSDTNKFQGDCDDLRFTNQAGRVLPHYVVSGCGTSSTEVQVFFDSFEAGPQNIYYYYGNPQAQNGAENSAFASEATNYTIGAAATEETAPGPIAYWKFDEGYGTTAYDSTNNQNDLSITGASWAADELCFNGKCLLFDTTKDGADDYASRADDPDLDFSEDQEFSITGWFRHTSSVPSADQVILAKHETSGGDGGYKIYMNNTSNLIAGIDDDNSFGEKSITLGQNYSDNEWHHFGMTVEGASHATLSLYVDGILAGTNVAATAQNSLENDDTFYVGIDGDGTSNEFDGHIDEVKVFRYALSDNGIKKDYLGVENSSIVLGDSDTSFLSEGLVGHWKMNEASWAGDCSTEDVLDSSGNLFHGTACPNGTGPSHTSPGKFNFAGSFDGSDDYINVGKDGTFDNLFTEGGTISAWININSFGEGGYGRITDKGSSYAAFHVCNDGGTKCTNSLAFQRYFSTSGNAWWSAADNLISSTNTWYHVAVTYDNNLVGNDPVFYVNGTRSQTTEVTAPVGFAPSDSSFDLYIGNRSGGSGDRAFDGELDDVRLYDRILSQAEVSALAKWAPKPVAYYTFDENDGITTVYDRSGNGNDITLGSGSSEPIRDLGKFGRGMFFDGTDDSGSSSYNSSLDFGTGSFTISYWLKSNQIRPEEIEVVDVAANGDDVMQSGGSSVTITGQYVDIGSIVGSTRDTTYRFTSVNIPQYSEINAATLRFHASNNRSNTTVNVTIAGHDAGNPAAPTDNTEFNTVESNLTSSQVNWNALESWSLAEFYTSPDISGAVDEIVNRGDWSANNAMQFWVGDNGSSSTAYRSIYAYDSPVGSRQPVRLSINYSPAGDGTLVSRYNNGGWLSSIDEAGDICIYIDDDPAWAPDDSACSSATDFSDGDWHHVTAVKDGTNSLSLYIDGVLKATDSTITATASLSGTTPGVVIGTDNSFGDQYKGNIDDLRIYNYARSPEQIVSDMNAGHPIPGSPIGSALLHYKFDEAYGDTLYDHGTGGNNGDLGGTGQTCPTTSDTTCPDWSKSGRYGGALSFDYGGTADYVHIPQNADLEFGSGNFSITAWFNISSTVPINTIAAYGDKNDSSGWDLRIQYGLPKFLVDDGTTLQTADDPNEYADSNWHHLVATVDKTNQIVLYTDGIMRDAESISSLGADWDTDDHDDIQVGRQWDGAAYYNYMDGYIDDFKIYNFVLAPNQVGTLYNQGFSDVFGATSTTAGGSAPSFSADREYCPPGDSTSTCAGPVGEWLFEKASGSSAYDTSANSNTGSFVQQVNWVNGRDAGWALDFNGDDDGTIDYLNIPDPAGGELDFNAQDFSVSAWVYPRETNQLAIHKRESTNEGYQLFRTGSGWSFNLVEVSSGDFCSTQIADSTMNEWIHVTGTYDASAGECRVYLDGGFGALNSSTTNPTNLNVSNSIDLTLASDTSLSRNMIIDNVRIYDYLRTPAQIAWEYNKGGPVAWWKLDECEGATAYDSTGNGYDGTITIGAGGNNTSIGTCSGSTGEAWADGASGKINGSLEFDSSDDHVQFSNDFRSGDSQGTIMGWIKKANFTDFSYILNAGDIADGNYQIGCATRSGSGKLYMWQIEAGSSELIESQVSITAGEWNHIACVSDGTDYSFYINGKDAGLSAGSGSGDWFADTSNIDTVRLGETVRDLGEVNGQLDEVKVFNYPLTPEQVRLDYTSSVVRFE
jgi:hypothetical protein